MSQKYSIKLNKTLFFNTYRAVVNDSSQNYIATIQIIPGLPLDRSEIPENAPEVSPYLTVIVEDAMVTSKNFLEFETTLTDALLKRMSTQDFLPKTCNFFYPSPAFMFEDPDKTIPN